MVKRRLKKQNLKFAQLAVVLSLAVSALIQAGLHPAARPSEAADAEVSSCAWQLPGIPLSSIGPEALFSDAETIDGSPIRCISDPYPEFNGITVDPVNDEVILSDGNIKSLLIYDRRAGGNSSEVAEPIRHIHGQQTGIGYIAGVAVDPVEREYYTVNNDVEDRMVVFSRDAEGNSLPVRVLYTPHQVYGVVLDLKNDELGITVQEMNAVLIYRKKAKGLEAPLRVITGPETGMADPRGLFIDSVNDEIVVANHGNYHDEMDRFPYASELKPLVRSAGRYQPPSLTFYSRTAKGNQAPVRTIQGPNTQLAWPMGIHVDTVNNEIAVANNGNNSILIFRRTDSGNVKPLRVIQGPRTNLDRPMGVHIDHKNDEIWVANFGNHSANVYARTANGNVAPKRIIRSAPAGTPTVGFGNPMAIAYDPVRDEILVPN